jgi:hypothetical protein
MTVFGLGFCKPWRAVQSVDDRNDARTEGQRHPRRILRQGVEHSRTHGTPQRVDSATMIS